MRIGVVFPTQPTDMVDIKQFGRWVEERPGTRLWAGQSTVIDSQMAGAFLAGAGIRAPMGISVALTPLTHPFQAAIQARSLALQSGSDVWAGFGTGGQEFAEALLGERYPRPAEFVGEYLDVVKLALSGQPFQHRGSAFTVTGQLPAITSGEVKVGAGVLRPYMARLAGGHADFIVTWLCPPAYVRDSLMPAMRAGARAVNRQPPEVISVMQFALDRHGHDPVDLVLGSSSGHLQSEHYRSMLTRAGVMTSPDQSAADLAGAVVAAGVMKSGTVDAICEEIRSFAEAGVNEVVLNPSGIYSRNGAAAALRDLDLVYRTYTGTSGHH